MFTRIGDGVLDRFGVVGVDLGEDIGQDESRDQLKAALVANNPLPTGPPGNRAADDGDLAFRLEADAAIGDGIVLQAAFVIVEVSGEEVGILD